MGADHGDQLSSPGVGNLELRIQLQTHFFILAAELKFRHGQ